ncbi:hypothetical protein MON38_16590 [Hymenobacter sp. DH14]|uniref:ASCH domain-containing protein n=1 Tax=Hymenobacter cyanobacteriorum TaxID=2926463 RepID=A0A9X1VI04_9BACT|nr:hypothetical protein [Hymenobacter cyanobacteriorum]MCI1189043.1 hypothetical protein [Hymenobacter cyanobacteriorum]
MRSISFNQAMLAAVRAGRKTVTRRRLPTSLPMQQEPARYRFISLSDRGALFEDYHAQPPALLPLVPLPFGPVGTHLIVAEDPGLVLKIVGLRAEQVRDLTEEDAAAEGIYARPEPGPPYWGGVESDAAHPGAFHWYGSPIAAFQGLLDSIYPTAWARNEWVWVIEFAKLPAAE